MPAARRKHDTEAAAEFDDRYKWSALANTTAATFMAVLDGSIVIIALPAIFRGIHLDPLAPGNIAFLLWMIMGYRLVQAVFVVTLGRLGDMYGRVRIYNAGFAVFTVASVLLSIDPYLGSKGALWLIAWRFVQAIGGSMLMANSAAILTDAFPENQRGFALGINQVAGLSGQFIGLVAGGLLAAWDWRAVFWVNVPVGIFGTLWAYWRLREVGTTRGAASTGGAMSPSRWVWARSSSLSPSGFSRTTGRPWDGPVPRCWPFSSAGWPYWLAFVVIESRVVDPLFRLGLFRIRAFAAGNVASFAARLGQGGLQFMLVIWLQGIWLPLHGYSYSSTPLWAGIFLLPLTAGFLLSGPLSGHLSDRYGARGFATTGMIVYGCSFIGLIFLPVNFSYAAFATLIAINGIGIGMFSAPNTSSMMSSVPAEFRGAASGMRATFQNSGTALSIGVFFSLMITGLASTCPRRSPAGSSIRVCRPPPPTTWRHCPRWPRSSPPSSGSTPAPPPVHGWRPAIAPVRRPARAHGQGVLPASPFGTVQPRPDHRLLGLGGPGLHLGHRLVDPGAEGKVDPGGAD